VNTESGEKQVPLTLPDLLVLGGRYRDEALDRYNTTLVLARPQSSASTRSPRASKGETPTDPPDPVLIRALSAARVCYTRALIYSPDNYEAELNLGVVHLVAASDSSETETARRAHLASAKQHLGRAYASRKGSYETLYFLALVAIEQKDHVTAKWLLEYLTNAKVRPAAVLMLQGRIAEQSNDETVALKLYATALNAGASDEISAFLLDKVKKEDGK
jgi:hypothetical protein